MYVLSVLGSALPAGAGPLSLQGLAVLPSPQSLAGDHASEAAVSNRCLKMPCSLPSSRNLQMRPRALQVGDLDVPRRSHTLQPLSRRCCWCKGFIRFAVGVTGAACAWACGGSLAPSPDKGSRLQPLAPPPHSGSAGASSRRLREGPWRRRPGCSGSAARGQSCCMSRSGRSPPPRHRSCHWGLAVS